MKALHNTIDNFGKSGVACELSESITAIFRFLLFVCAKLPEIKDLPYNSNLHVFEGFYKFSVDKFKDHFRLLLDNGEVSDLGESIGLTNNIQSIINKIKSICAKANTSYTYLNLYNEWNVPNSGSD